MTAMWFSHNAKRFACITGIRREQKSTEKAVMKRDNFRSLSENQDVCFLFWKWAIVAGWTKANSSAIAGVGQKRKYYCTDLEDGSVTSFKCCELALRLNCIIDILADNGVFTRSLQGHKMDIKVNES